MTIDVQNDIHPHYNEIPKEEWCNKSDGLIYNQLELLKKMKRLPPACLPCCVASNANTTTTKEITDSVAKLTVSEFNNVEDKLDDALNVLNDKDDLGNDNEDHVAGLPIPKDAAALPTRKLSPNLSDKLSDIPSLPSLKAAAFSTPDVQNNNVPSPTKLSDIKKNHVPSPIDLEGLFTMPPPSTIAPYSTAATTTTTTTATIDTPPVVNSDGNFTPSGFGGPTGYDYEEHIIMKNYDNSTLSPPQALEEASANDTDEVPLDVKPAAVATTPTNIPYPTNIPRTVTRDDDDDDDANDDDDDEEEEDGSIPSPTAAGVSGNLTTSPEYQPSAGEQCSKFFAHIFRRDGKEDSPIDVDTPYSNAANSVISLSSTDAPGPNAPGSNAVISVSSTDDTPKNDLKDDGDDDENDKDENDKDAADSGVVKPKVLFE